jgi:hypothetical protein
MTTYVSSNRLRSLPEPGADDEEPWWLTPYGARRLAAEARAMRERFPEFVPFLDDETLGWRGRLWRPFFDGEAHFVVEVKYPSRFPEEPPAVRIVSPPLPDGTPHLLFGNQPCLFQSAQGPRHGYDPGRTTAATFVAWTALWIHAYEVWDRTGAWPGRAA